MYTKEQASKVRQEFWTTFGKFMAPVPGAEGLPVNWINYKTGVKDIRFRMEAGRRDAYIGIELSHKDPEDQARTFEKFWAHKEMLEEHLQEEWEWELMKQDEHGKLISRIYCNKPGVSIFNRDSWPDIISFLKPKMIALDDFWSNAKYGFEEEGLF